MVEVVPGHGLLVRAGSATAARDEVHDWLDAHGVDLLDEVRIHEAWYAPDAGFVQKTHDQAEQVYVVNLPPAVLAELG